jgi:hypothetical protein
MQVDAGTIVSIVGFATLFMTRVFDIIDRGQKAAELRRQTEADAAALKLHTTEQAAILKNAVDENTKLTKEGTAAAKDAYNEANTVNQKLETIGVKMLDGKPLGK